MGQDNRYSYVTGGSLGLIHRKRIAVGVSGEVHEVFDTVAGQSIARKLVNLLNLDNIEFSNEMRTITGLSNASHKNIIKVLRHGSLEGSHRKYIDMELCLFTLREYIDSSLIVFRASRHHPPWLKAAQTCNIMAQVADGLSFIHAQGLTHRNLKPQNVLYSSKTDTWKLSDFGIAWGGTLDAGYGGETQGFRAPELLLDHKSAPDKKIDIWAMGCILYQLVTGKSAFLTDSAALEYHRGNSDLEIKINDGYHEACKLFLSKIITQMMNKASFERPSAAELFLFFSAKYSEAIAEQSRSLDKSIQALTFDEKDIYFTNTISTLYDDIAGWCSSNFSGEIKSDYSEEDITIIRSIVGRLKEENNGFPGVLWQDIDLIKMLSEPDFRVDFVMHIIGLWIHEIFSRFMHDQEFGLSYWFQRCADELVSESVEVSHKWASLTMQAWNGVKPGSKPLIQKEIKDSLSRIYSRLQSGSDTESVFSSLDSFLHRAIDLSESMRQQSSRYVSYFPINGHSESYYIGGFQRKDVVTMCRFPGIIKQSKYLQGREANGFCIAVPRVSLESKPSNMKEKRENYVNKKK